MTTCRYTLTLTGAPGVVRPRCTCGWAGLAAEPVQALWAGQRHVDAQAAKAKVRGLSAAEQLAKPVIQIKKVPA
jgi:hypothetical protein